MADGGCQLLPVRLVRRLPDVRQLHVDLFGSASIGGNNLGSFNDADVRRPGQPGPGRDRRRPSGRSSTSQAEDLPAQRRHRARSRSTGTPATRSTRTTSPATTSRRWASSCGRRSGSRRPDPHARTPVDRTDRGARRFGAVPHAVTAHPAVTTFVLRRLGQLLLVLWGAVTLLFFLFFLLPDNPAELIAGGNGARCPTRRWSENVEKKYGLRRARLGPVREVPGPVGHLRLRRVVLATASRSPTSSSSGRRPACDWPLGHPHRGVRRHRRRRSCPPSASTRSPTRSTTLLAAVLSAIPVFVLGVPVPAGHRRATRSSTAGRSGPSCPSRASGPTSGSSGSSPTAAQVAVPDPARHRAGLGVHRDRGPPHPHHHARGRPRSTTSAPPGPRA